MTKVRFWTVSILLFGAFIASGVFFLSNEKTSEAAFNSKFIEQVGDGLIAPACGSSDTSVTCSGSSPLVTINWTDDWSPAGGSYDACFRISPGSVINTSNMAMINAGNSTGGGVTQSYTWTGAPNNTGYPYDPGIANNTQYTYEVNLAPNGGTSGAGNCSNPTHGIIGDIGAGASAPAGTFTTPNCVADQPPVANAKISKDGTTYTDSIIATQGVPTTIFLGANDSSDPDGWTHPTQGVSNGGKCEWNSDLNQGAPTFEQTINNPASPSACNISLGTLTFNDAPGTYTYQVLKITDKQSAASNIDTVQVTVTPLCPAGQVKPYATCQSGSCVSVNACGVTSCASDSFCKPGDGLTQCTDGIDNDSDGKVDHADSLLRGSNPTDPGCSSVSDDDETDVVACLSGETRPYSVCQSGSCVSVNACGVSTCNNNQQCAPQPDYSLTNSGSISATVVGTSPAQSSNTTIRVTPLNGFNAAVNLSVQSVSPPLPSGAQHVFSDSALNSGEYSNGSAYHVIVPGTTATGTYIVAVQGQGGGLTRSTSLNLNVNVTSPEFKEVFNPFFQLWTRNEIPILYLPASLLLGF
ncbi:MAG: hypothetical protein Q8Q97_00635 [bacterium]|nr:hypothetical protein [bacterium]